MPSPVLAAEGQAASTAPEVALPGAAGVRGDAQGAEGQQLGGAWRSAAGAQQVGVDGEFAGQRQSALSKLGAIGGSSAPQPLLAADAVSRPSSRAASPALPDRPPEQEQFGGRE